MTITSKRLINFFITLHSHLRTTRKISLRKIKTHTTHSHPPGRVLNCLLFPEFSAERSRTAHHFPAFDSSVPCCIAPFSFYTCIITSFLSNVNFFLLIFGRNCIFFQKGGISRKRSGSPPEAASFCICVTDRPRPAPGRCRTARCRYSCPAHPTGFPSRSSGASLP